MVEFEFATASIIGRDHILAVKNCQDASHMASDGDFTVAVVADGCGSQPHSEVGAKLGVRWLVPSLLKGLKTLTVQATPDAFAAASGELAALWETAGRRPLLEHIRKTADTMRFDGTGGNFSAIIQEYFLFTVTAIIITPTVTQVASIGDGVAFVNGEHLPTGPFEGNAPPYVSYGLVNTTLAGSGDERFMFKVLKSLPTSELQSFLIGCDGVDYLAAAAEKNFPGTANPVGPLSQLWTLDRFYKNPDNLRRLLAMANMSSVRVDKTSGAKVQEHGHLKDDTTLIVGRRKAVSVTAAATSQTAVSATATVPSSGTPPAGSEGGAS